MEIPFVSQVPWVFEPFVVTGCLWKYFIKFLFRDKMSSDYEISQPCLSDNKRGNKHIKWVNDSLFGSSEPGKLKKTKDKPFAKVHHFMVKIIINNHEYWILIFRIIIKTLELHYSDAFVNFVKKRIFSC
jgi:hypothetical protein